MSEPTARLLQIIAWSFAVIVLALTALITRIVVGDWWGAVTPTLVVGLPLAIIGSGVVDEALKRAFLREREGKDR